MRKTSRELSRLLAAAVAATPGLVPAFSLVVVGTDKALKFTGKISIGGTVYECAGDNGKVKTFSNVDDFLKYAAKATERGDGVYTLSVDTGAVLASSVPSNIATWAAAQITKLGKVKTNQNALIAEIDVQLAAMAGWENGNQAQQAKKVEVQAQRAAVVTDVAAIDTELARLATLV